MGLRAAHAAGVPHGNLRSNAVVLETTGRNGTHVVVIDFGLSAFLDWRPVLHRCEGERLIANISYLAPERLEGGSASAATDIFAFGVILFEVLTGHLPWRGTTALETALARLQGQPPPPSQIVEAVAKLDPFVLRCLSRHPEDRYENAAVALEAFDEVSAAVT